MHNRDERTDDGRRARSADAAGATDADGASNAGVMGGGTAWPCVEPLGSDGRPADNRRIGVDELASGLLSGGDANVMLIAGPSRSGKTLLCRRLLVAGLRAAGDGAGVMCVAGRQEADRIGDEVIRELGATSQARPVTTLSAVAFRLINAMRSRGGMPLPKLLNGAEQDALLRQVADSHVRHVQTGEPCDVCAMLRSYFASDDWANVMSRERDDDLPRGIDDAFVMQLRDMISRMNELGIDASREPRILTALGAAAPSGPRNAPLWTARVERLRIQWMLAFALRRQYAGMIERAYPGQFRLDSSRLLVEGAQVARECPDELLPRFVVVDGYQDLTLAGLAFLETLHDRGVGLALVGNPDEAVQTFRGSFPEYLFEQARTRLSARELRIVSPADIIAEDHSSRADRPRREPALRALRDGGDTYADLLASRISLSIHSTRHEDRPIALRAGKEPALEEAAPIRMLAADDRRAADRGVETGLYRSPAEEIDDVVWRIKREHLLNGRPWSDMALIAHDNTTVRAFGERLRHDGVPVRYSSVTRPLRDEPFVQGLFALLELARLRDQARRGNGGGGGPIDSGASLIALAATVRSRVRMLMDCPLIAVGADRTHEGHPARLDVIESAMNSIGSLAGIVGADNADAASPAAAQSDAADNADAVVGTGIETDAGTRLMGLIHEWDAMLGRARQARGQADVIVDDSLVAGQSADSATLPQATLPQAASPQAAPNAAPAPAQPTVASAAVDEPSFGRDALYLLLMFGDCDEVLASIQAVCGSDRNADAFAHLWNLVDRVRDGFAGLPSGEPQYALWLAWQTCDVANRWQRVALGNDNAARAANDRLDAAMRLFDYASGAAAAHDLDGFIAQVRSMRIEADSLAKVAPLDQAVTLTTPAGAAGRHWPLVWLPAIQQGVWPNLAERNAMFGGDDLADVVLDGVLSDERDQGGDPHLEATLAAEQRGLLVAVTRADERLSISAVCNDDMTPSDFLYGYLPERYDRAQHADPHRRRYTEVGHDDRFAGLDMTPRALVAAARVELASNDHDSAGVEDAVAALHELASAGVDAADPEHWAFSHEAERHAQGDALPAVHEPLLGASAASVASSASSRPADSTDAALQADAAPIVTLSPSAVDGLWECPVCWLLENRFSGPRISSAALSFGTIIHAVAQKAAEQGWDLPDHHAELPIDGRIDAIRDEMMAVYRDLRADPRLISDPTDRYKALQKDAKAAETIRNIADYFVTSNTADYPGGNAKYFSIGTLQQSDCEVEFTATIGLNDIQALYNAIPGIAPVGIEELAAIMGSLIGGWPDGFRDDLRVRLSGRADRIERRLMDDGSSILHLIDYKTGGAPKTERIFNDLQLVCYQLGVLFADSDSAVARSIAHNGVIPPIGGCALFHVAQKNAPAHSHSPEGLFQPPLAVDGHLNDQAFTVRDHYKALSGLSDAPDPAQTPHEGVSDEAWASLVGLRGTQTIWALTMISRVFYAAAASRSTRIAAHHPSETHLQYCRMLQVCPACAGGIETIYESRTA